MEEKEIRIPNYTKTDILIIGLIVGFLTGLLAGTALVLGG